MYTSKHILPILFLSAPYIIYGADADYMNSSISWQTYKLISQHDQHNFDALDGIDAEVVQISVDDNVFDAQHALTAGSLALPVGFVVYKALCHANQRTRFEPISMALAASSGFKILEAGGGAIATLIAGGSIYWGLKKFFTSDLKHKFAALEKKVKESEAAYQLGLKTHKEILQAEIASINKKIKNIGQTNGQVMEMIGRQRQRLKQMYAKNPADKDLKELVDSTEETGQILQNLGEASPEALRHKSHINPFKWFWHKIHPKASHR